MKYLVILITMLSLSFSSVEQVDKYKALFMFKFIQNMEWPAGKTTEAYKIAIMGNTELIEQMNEIANGRNVNGRPIQVEPFVVGQSLQDVHILFIADSQLPLFEELKDEALSSSAVIITDSRGYGEKGACINFIMDGNRLKYELNTASINEASIVVSASIKSLAVLVN